MSADKRRLDHRDLEARVFGGGLNGFERGLVARRGQGVGVPRIEQPRVADEHFFAGAQRQVQATALFEPLQLGCALLRPRRGPCA